MIDEPIPLTTLALTKGDFNRILKSLERSIEVLRAERLICPDNEDTIVEATINYQELWNYLRAMKKKVYGSSTADRGSEQTSSSEKETS